MKKLAVLVLVFCMAGALAAKDTIVTRQNKKYYGVVIDRKGGHFVIRITDGSIVEIPEENVSKITRDNVVYDLEAGLKYYLEVKRPFLPFVVLGVAAGAYAVKRFNDYADLHREAEEELAQGGAVGAVINTRDQKQAIAEGIVSTLFSVGSFYIAVRPMKVKVGMGTIELSMQAPRPGVMLSLRF